MVFLLVLFFATKKRTDWGLRGYPPLTEGIGEEFDFDLGGYAFIENVIDRIQDWHVNMTMPVYLLHTFGTKVTLSNHLHFNLG